MKRRDVLLLTGLLLSVGCDAAAAQAPKGKPGDQAAEQPANGAGQHAAPVQQAGVSPPNIALDNLVSGLLGAVVGSMLTIGYDLGERRRLERLTIAERLHPVISLDAERPSLMGRQASARDLAGLVYVQPLRRRLRVGRLVRQYQQACQQQQQQDALGQLSYTDPGRVAAAAAALLPYTGHL